jgi:chemotaxis protein histidine kinase CheA
MTTDPKNAGGTAPDHEVIVPPTNLKAYAKYVPGEGLDEAALARAEEALQGLQENFEVWMQQEVDVLVAAREALTEAAPSSRGIDPLYRASHDLRGQAATFGYPLAGEIASNLCNYLDATAAPASVSMDLVDVHINAIVAVLREGVRDSNNQLARAVLQELSEARKRFAPVVDEDSSQA